MKETTLILRRTVLLPVRLYRKALSPLKKPSCKYIPTCSEYCEMAVMKYGVTKGALKSANRILRCNPFAHGGYDPP